MTGAESCVLSVIVYLFSEESAPFQSTGHAPLSTGVVYVGVVRVSGANILRLVL